MNDTDFDIIYLWSRRYSLEDISTLTGLSVPHLKDVLIKNNIWDREPK
jgi:hypothetical protein